MSRSDKAMLELAKEMGDEKSFDKTDVAVYFGKPNETVDDPIWVVEKDQPTPAVIYVAAVC